jgi:adenylate cyclase
MSQKMNDLHKFTIRIGINSGKIGKAAVGSATLKDHTVIGDAVNIAYALEERNKVHQTSILITKSTYENIRENVVVREIGVEKLKSRNMPVTIYELLGIS